MKKTKIINGWAILRDDKKGICIHQTGKNIAYSIFLTKKMAMEENADPEYHKVVRCRISYEM